MLNYDPSSYTNIFRGAPDPDPAGYPVNLVDPDPAGSEVGSGKYWPDLHNYDIKHHSILLFHNDA